MKEERTMGQKIIRFILRLIILLLILAIIGMVLIGNYFADYLVSPDSDFQIGNIEETMNPVDVSSTSAVEDSSGNSWATTAKYEEVSITSDDNTEMKGYLYKDKMQKHNYIIMLPAYKQDASSMYDYAKRFTAKGYGVLIVDPRACGQSGGKYLGMGYLDKKDVKKWIQYIAYVDTDSHISLFGLGTGAAAVLMAAGDGVSSNVSCVVVDSCFTTLFDIVDKNFDVLFDGVPTFPTISVSSFMIKAKAGYTLDDVNVTDAVKNCKVPVLFITGTEDGITPVEMSDELYQACDSTKEQYKVTGAGHLCAKDVNPGEYVSKVSNFIQKNTTNN